MTIRIQGPDGSINEFPDGMADADIERVMQQHYGGPDTKAGSETLAPGPFTQRTPDGRLITRPPTAAESKPMDWAAAVNAAAAGAVDMATFNQGNKLDAALQSLTGVGGTKGDYAGNLARVQAANAQAQAANPGAYAAGGAIGGMANPITKAVSAGADALLPTTGTGALGALSRYANRIGQGALNGAGYGAGFANPGQEGSGAIKGAIGGGLTAGAAQLVADAAAPLLNRKVVSTMTQEQFKRAAQKAYKAVDDAGVSVSPEAYQEFVSKLPSELNGFHPRVTPGAANIIGALQDEAAQGPITLSTLDKLRSIAGEASVSADRNEARLAGNIADKIDDFVDGLKPSDLAGGIENAEAAKDSLTTARELWRTYSKMKTISDIVDTGENLNNMNWVKGRFAAIVKKPSLFNRYTEDEKQAISDIARTGTLEKIGKIIPWRGLQMTTTYAEPLAQDMKINALQNLVASGGVKPPAAPRSAIPTYFSGYGGLALSRLLQPHQANAQ